MKPLIAVSSVIANKPHNGGNASMVLNWLQGLERLGADVFFLEQIRSDVCVDAGGAPAPANASVNQDYFDRVVGGELRRGRRAALICDAGDTLDGATLHGATAAELHDLARDAHLLINISGHLSVSTLKRQFRRKVYVDLDPGYTQLWHAEGLGAARLEGHDAYFTVGQCIGTPGCRIPTSGITWHPFRQPIVLDRCGLVPVATSDRFTTVASWRGAYSPITHGGETFRVKAHEFRKIVQLPRLSPRDFEVALEIHPEDATDLTALETAGWRVVDPRSVAETPEEYCAYIDGSAAECSAAQGIYVQTNSGWFSDRTARYLAAGKPALVQDTGFLHPPQGEGLIAFDTLDDAARGVERIARDYREHSEAARSLAERYFNSDVELARILEAGGTA